MRPLVIVVDIIGGACITLAMVFAALSDLCDGAWERCWRLARRLDRR